MKIIGTLVCCVLFVPTLLMAQAPTQSVDVGVLKSQLAAQQKTLDQQQKQIQALQSALDEQRKMLLSMAAGAENPNAVALQKSVEDLQTSVNDIKAQKGQAVSQPLSPEAQKTEEELQHGPEIADVIPDSPGHRARPDEDPDHRLSGLDKRFPVHEWGRQRRHEFRRHSLLEHRRRSI